MGFPGEPVPGSPGQVELRSRVHVPEDRGDAVREAIEVDIPYLPSMLKITRQDLRKYGYTANCQGCLAINRGSTAQHNTEECRRMIIKEISKEEGEGRINRERQRFEHHREEQDKEGVMRRKTKKAHKNPIKTRRYQPG
jgi:hypothetical protein